MGGNGVESQRYAERNYCQLCRRWVPKQPDRCPYCGNAHIRRAPKMRRCRQNYKPAREYTVEDAERIYARFLSRGYSPEEAREFTLAITGLEVEHPQPRKQLILEVAGA